jgi:endo-1,3(4)-beta-glucanase
VGRTDLIDPLISWLEKWFSYWFDPTAPTQAAYETAWGMMINKAGYNNITVDFGNGYGNDHRKLAFALLLEFLARPLLDFHYGYFLAAAAIIAKYDTAWRDQHKEFFNWFLRDIANPSPSDPHFPVTRCRDWFAGHSWGKGKFLTRPWLSVLLLFSFWNRLWSVVSRSGVHKRGSQWLLWCSTLGNRN